jgi:orotidine-5'-phosphate decarboxylase
MSFSTDVAAATAQFALAFQTKLAIWQAVGAEEQLAKLIAYIQGQLGRPVILDANYGDVPAISAEYAKAAFDRFDASAVTLNVYHGRDSLVPWLKRGPEKGLFVVCHTSNDMASDFQDLQVNPVGNGGHLPLFVHLAHQVLQLRSDDSATIGFVMDEAFPMHITSLRPQAGDWWWQPSEIPLLIGYSSGQLEELVGRASFYPFLLSCSRGIIHASEESDFAQAAANAAEGLRNRVNMVLENKEGCRVG